MRMHSNDIKLDYKDVLIVPQRSDIPSRTSVQLTRTYKFKHSPYKLTGMGIIAANMDTTGTFAMADILSKHKMFVALHKHYSRQELFDFFSKDKRRRWRRTFVTVGSSGNEMKNILQVRAELSDMEWPMLVNVDVANGMTESFVKTLKYVRKMCPKSVIMAGNVVGSNMAEHLILCGADIVKIGIGPGSVCLTRKVSGVGYPQLSAIDEAGFTAHGLQGSICADGGCTRVGDIGKAFAAGADFVMIGGLLAGTDECEGEWVYKNTSSVDWEYYERHKQEYKHELVFYGMASKEAQDKYDGGLKDYKAAEGKTVRIPYKGKALDVIREIKGGLSSTCTYVGASCLKDLPKCASFVRCSQQENTVFGE